MKRAVVVVALAGCARIFGLDEGDPSTKADAAPRIDAPPAIDAGPVDNCHVDVADGLRYAPVANAVTFQLAVAECTRLDMVPAAFVTQAEYNAASTKGVAPYWTGVRLAGDGTPSGFADCDVFLPNTVNPANGTCVVADINFMYEAAQCGTMLANVLCETPPRTAECERQAQPHSESDYTVLAAQTQASGASACAAMGMHLIEIDSDAEATLATQLVPTEAFWVAGEWDTDHWTASPTTCPIEFRWASGQPQPSGTQCAAMTTNGATTEACQGSHRVICEKNP